MVHGCGNKWDEHKGQTLKILSRALSVITLSGYVCNFQFFFKRKKSLDHIYQKKKKKKGLDHAYAF